MAKEKGQVQYFASRDNGMMFKIILCAVLFHALLVGVCIGIHYIDFKKEPEPIPVFEMVQVQQPPRVRPTPPKPKPPEPKPEVQEPKPDVKPKPTPKPKVNKQLPPDIKPEEKKPDPEPDPQPDPDPQPEPEPEPQEPVDDFDIDDMDLPTAVEAPSLNPVGSVDMDPLMQVYLERLKQIIMGNFNPPSNLKIRKDIKTTVQFTVDRFGGITAITLKRSSGNKTWDHLSVRAVQISKVPELPPNYRAPSLILHFNFTPN